MWIPQKVENFVTVELLSAPQGLRYMNAVLLQYTVEAFSVKLHAPLNNLKT